MKVFCSNSKAIKKSQPKGPSAPPPAAKEGTGGERIVKKSFNEVLYGPDCASDKYQHPLQRLGYKPEHIVRADQLAAAAAGGSGASDGRGTGDGNSMAAGGGGGYALKRTSRVTSVKPSNTAPAPQSFSASSPQERQHWTCKNHHNSRLVIRQVTTRGSNYLRCYQTCPRSSTT